MVKHVVVAQIEAEITMTMQIMAVLLCVLSLSS